MARTHPYSVVRKYPHLIGGDEPAEGKEPGAFCKCEYEVFQILRAVR